MAHPFVKSPLVHASTSHSTGIRRIKRLGRAPPRWPNGSQLLPLPLLYYLTPPSAKAGGWRRNGHSRSPLIYSPSSPNPPPRPLPPPHFPSTAATPPPHPHPRFAGNGAEKQRRLLLLFLRFGRDHREVWPGVWPLEGQQTWTCSCFVKSRVPYFRFDSIQHHILLSLLADI